MCLRGLTAFEWIGSLVHWVGYGLASQPMAPPKEEDESRQSIQQSERAERGMEWLWLGCLLFGWVIGGAPRHSSAQRRKQQHQPKEWNVFDLLLFLYGRNEINLFNWMESNKEWKKKWICFCFVFICVCAVMGAAKTTRKQNQKAAASGRAEWTNEILLNLWMKRAAIQQQPHQTTQPTNTNQKSLVLFVWLELLWFVVELLLVWIEKLL